MNSQPNNFMPRGLHLLMFEVVDKNGQTSKIYGNL